MSWSDNPESVRAHRLGCKFAAAKRSKYRNVPTVVNGERFASKKEARRHAELLLLKRAGEITSLERQPRYCLKVNDKTITTYVGDWRYVERQKDGKLLLVVEDAKGIQTPAFKIKFRLAAALFPEIEWRLS